MNRQEISELKHPALKHEWVGEISAIIDANKNRVPNKYDCVMILDGSIESIYQLAVIRHVYGVNPLTATFNHGQSSPIEEFRREWALEKFDVDNITFNARKSVIARFSGHYLENVKLSGITSFAFRISHFYELPFIILGSPISKRSFGLADNFAKVDQPVWEGIASRLIPANLNGHQVSRFDMVPYTMPNLADLQANKTRVLFVGDSFQADPARQNQVLTEEFKLPGEGEIQNILNTRAANEEKRLAWHLRPGRDTPTRDTEWSLKYKKLAQSSEFGKPLFDGTLRYCQRCCLPETSEELSFDEMGICQPCRSSEQKMHINWVERQASLKHLLEKYKNHNDYYDCMIPISGGKDSTFQVYALTELHGMRPLGVTFSHNWYSETGKKNLQNAYERFDMDHVMFIPRRSVINKVARKSLYMIGDSCWHCHAGVGAFPLQAAVKFQVPLLIWGESSAENADGRATYEEPISFHRDSFTQISARFYAEQLADDDLSLLDLDPYILPTMEEFDAGGLKGIYLGDYMFWDDERQMEFIRDKYGWKEDRVESQYKGYKSVECRMAGVHDYTKFLKRGFGRGTDHASLDVRNGLLTREEGFELAKKFDTERPEALDYYMEITGYTEAEIEEILKKKRDDKARNLP